MSKLFLFMMVTVDGFFEGPDHDISWHNVDDEFNDFAAKQMEEMSAILFGRRTYELMRDFWPNYQPEDKANTIVRDQMDTLPKIVFSKTLSKVEENENWKHVEVFQDVDAAYVQVLKQKSQGDIAVLGSSNLCVTLLEKGLLDELRIMVNPVVIGKGTRLFEGLQKKQTLELTDTRQFQNGNTLLTYHVKKPLDK